MSTAFSSAFTVGSSPPPLGCWQVDHSCCGWSDTEPLDPPQAVRDRADVLAIDTFTRLTGYRVGGCPVKVRPCRQGCSAIPTYLVSPVAAGVGSWAAPGGTFTPVLSGGVWTNTMCGCGVTGCACVMTCEVLLGGEVGEVVSVDVDGVTIDPTAYRLDPPNRLVRTDGGDCWPLCQDMNAPPGSPGTFTVEYVPGPVPTPADEFAVGALACEYAKACTGQTCGLPKGAIMVARLGVTIERGRRPGQKDEQFPMGLTGLPVVDDRILFYNPNGLALPSTVWSPDVHRGRATT